MTREFPFDENKLGKPEFPPLCKLFVINLIKVQ